MRPRHASINAMTIALLGLMIILGGAQSPARAQEATLGVDDIIKGMDQLVETWRSQKNWMVRYKHTRELKDSPPGARVPYPPNEITNARRGEWFLVKEKHELLSRGPVLKLNGEIREAWYSWNGKISVERDMDNFSILPELSARSYQVFLYPGWLCLDLLADMRVRSDFLKTIFNGENVSAGQWDTLPRSVIAHREDFRVRSQLEVIDGAPCHVLERPGKDILWIDVARNFTFRRRIYYQSPGSILFQSDNMDYIQTAPGIWIPKKQVASTYNLDDKPERYRGKVQVVQTNLLLESRFNDLPDSFFEVPVPERATVTDYLRGVTYEKHPDGVDPWASTIARGRLDVATHSPKPRNWLELSMFAGSGIGILLLLYQLKDRAGTPEPTGESKSPATGGEPAFTCQAGVPP